MAKLQTKNVKISGVCGALPRTVKTVYEVGEGFFDEPEIRKITLPIGVGNLYFAEEGQTASDLCYVAAERLIDGLGWQREEIDGLIFVSQTPDYIAPATSCLLQDRLGLSTGCFAFDMNFGCSAFVSAYFLAANLIDTGACSKVLLLIGDTLRRYVSPEDKGLTFIISDAGTATALERSTEGVLSSVIMSTDGSGSDALIVPAGGARMPMDSDTGIVSYDDDGNGRSSEDFYMDGMAVFTFAVKRVPALIDELAELHGMDKADFEYFLLHQANAYMLKFIAKRSRLPLEKFPVNIGRYGNTNGSTIPLLICDLASKELSMPKDVIMSGFGVGLSWGGVATSLGGLAYAGIVAVE
ncbi:MAG: ketoacyl-ACP synthase III [Clostridiales Family XIII bacterium]|jgi:3-oxoacyl-[acyl-carrier-protein] synthase-3|nr:ketoacyl-ACP synthase III [Clostridiales Family XIII bacterium]